MKKNGLLILLIIVIVLLIALILLKDININFNKEKGLSLEQIKARLVNTKKIYVCKDWNGINHICGGKKLVRIVEDENIIEKFINITNSLDEYTGASTADKDRFSIFFVDSKNKVIVAADFGIHYIIKTDKIEYDISSEKNAQLRELLEFDF